MNFVKYDELLDLQTILDARKRLPELDQQRKAALEKAEREHQQARQQLDASLQQTRDETAKLTETVDDRQKKLTSRLKKHDLLVTTPEVSFTPTAHDMPAERALRESIDAFEGATDALKMQLITYGEKQAVLEQAKEQADRTLEDLTEQKKTKRREAEATKKRELEEKEKQERYAKRRQRLAQVLRIPQILILIAFFMPFATVFDGCSVDDEDNTINETVTGYELATGTGIPEGAPLVFGVVVIAVICLALTVIEFRFRFALIGVLSTIGGFLPSAEPEGYNTVLETGGALTVLAFIVQPFLLIVLFTINIVRFVFRFIRQRWRARNTSAPG